MHNLKDFNVCLYLDNTTVNSSNLFILQLPYVNKKCFKHNCYYSKNKIVLNSRQPSRVVRAP